MKTKSCKITEQVYEESRWPQAFIFIDLLCSSAHTTITNHFLINILHGPYRKHRFQQGVFTDPLLRNGSSSIVQCVIISA
jgi:hypothetical protein